MIMMGFKNDRQRRAAFASMNKFSYAAPVVVQRVVPATTDGADVYAFRERKPSGLEILGQAGEKLAGGVVETWPATQRQEVYGPGVGPASRQVVYRPRETGISALWPEQSLEDMLVGITSATWPDSSEGRVVDDRHYYIDVV